MIVASKAFFADVQLMSQNAAVYNGEDSTIAQEEACPQERSVIAPPIEAGTAQALRGLLPRDAMPHLGIPFWAELPASFRSR
ncbi:unnamed protein product [Choristocarpus tenellus]